MEAEDLGIDSLQMIHLAYYPLESLCGYTRCKFPYLKTPCLKAHFWMLSPQRRAVISELFFCLSLLLGPHPVISITPKPFFYRTKQISQPGGKSHNAAFVPPMLSSLLSAPRLRALRSRPKDLQGLS